ncbi:ABC transporter permease [Haladaptatus pallidirubidus]|uniref:ABC transmembrane type-1 domain-containing protein n=1 Tax=Haladaptatus pallidirubidus TaxID=1008152 RepID=A0AAV3USJ2_9EURY|nr:ABC transporter permease [Haladaptatus pallidirubidus]
MHSMIFANLWTGWLEYIIHNQTEFWSLLSSHLRMVLIGEFAAILVAVPAGIVATRHKQLGWIVMNLGAVAQTIPPLAVIALSFTAIGLGQRPAILALFFYALLPILKNTAAGIRQVEDSQLEAGRGMGMTDLQRLRRIELPLASPVIFSGIRTSTVMSIGVAYLGAFIGAGGFGKWVILGQQRFETDILLAGAIPGAVLVILLDQAFARLESHMTPTNVSTDEGTGTQTA